MLCECHYQQLGKRSNMRSCLLPSHSSTLSDTPIPTRLYKLFDKAARRLIKVLHCAHILQVNKCSLLKIFLYDSESGRIHNYHPYCIFYSTLQSWWKNLSQPCTGIMRVAVNLLTDLMICSYFVRLMHHISFTSSSVQQKVQMDMPLVRGIHIYSTIYFTYCFSLAFTSNYKVPAQSFAIQRIKIYYILYNLQNFQVSFILTVSAVTGTKQPLFLSVITGIICNFPQISENITSPKISSPGLHRLQGGSWALAVECV